MPFFEKSQVRIYYEEAGSGFPVLTIIPSRALKVFGAQFTLTQPDRSFPLKSGTNPSSAACKLSATIKSTPRGPPDFIALL